jgi:hypothetical protein
MHTNTNTTTGPLGRFLLEKASVIRDPGLWRSFSKNMNFGEIELGLGYGVVCS